MRLHKLIILSIAFFIMLSPFAQAEEAQPKAVTSVNAWDFGEIIKGKAVSCKFNINNQGSAILTLGRMYSSCSCSTISASSKMLWPGDNAEIAIEYDSKEEPIGSFSKDFYIETNDHGQKEIKFTIKGKVVGEIASIVGLEGSPRNDNTHVIARRPKADEAIAGGQALMTASHAVASDVELASSPRNDMKGRIASDVGLEGLPRNDNRRGHLSVPYDVRNDNPCVIARSSPLFQWRTTKQSIKLCISALIAGFIVSLLESVCTGQVYLPTIVFVMGLPDLRSKAFLYLVFYNLMFIVPLVLVFLAALKGAASEKFASFAGRHLGAVKLITAGLFLGLGIFLLTLQK